MSYAEDHPILDVIFEAVGESLRLSHDMSRESECLEFTDPEDGQRYEIVVRPIDDDDDEEEDA